MKIEKQKFSLPITNHDEIIEDTKIKKHGVLFGGDSKRGLLIGSSGSGKTNVMLSLLEHPNGLRFENIYLYAKSLYQPKYEYLRMLMKSLPEIGYFEYSDGDDVIAPEEIKPNSVIVFDDVQCSNHDKIKSYYCFGRHKNTDVFYQAQTYSAIPKQLVRDNVNLLIVLQQDVTNLKHIFEDHVNVDLSFKDFQDMCAVCWKDKYGFLVIDKDCRKDEGRYRMGFDNFIHI